MSRERDLRMRFALMVLAAAILAAPAMAQPVRVGDVINLTYESPRANGGGKDAGMRLVWQEELTVPGASYIAPHFSRFALPEGAELIVRAPDGSRSWTYTGFGKSDELMEEGFWGIHINGDTAILELHARGRVRAKAVVVDSIGHGYPTTDWNGRLFKTGLPFEEPITKSLCGADDMEWAQCYQSSEPTAYDRGRAVVRLLTQKSAGGFLCTGWLVGSEGHMMTNNHCIANQTEANNTTYEFMAEGSCTTNCPQLACDGVIEANSATFVKTAASLDYTLLRLPTNVSGTYGFLQLRDSGAVLNERMYIVEHPGGKGKRIAIESTDSSNPSGFCEVDQLNMPSCVSNEIGYKCDTEGGSSGSPVIGYSDHCVIAIHNCGGCNNGGVPIDNIINNLGSDLPQDALCGGAPPPPPPPPPPGGCSGTEYTGTLSGGSNTHGAGSKSGTVTATLSCTSGSADLDLFLDQESCNFWGCSWSEVTSSESSSCGESISTSVGSGTYRWRVLHWSGGSASYSLCTND